MSVEVFFGVGQMMPPDVSGRVVVVIDVLRAATSIAVALHNGARNVIPFDSSEEVILRSKSFDRSEVRLAGERKMLPIPGFDLGNSPSDYGRDVVEGRTVLMSTTNGTGTLVAVQSAREVVVGSYVNFSATLALLRSALRGGTPVAIVCAGRERRFSLEDAACAGRFVRYLGDLGDGFAPNDAARAALHLEMAYGDDIERLFLDSQHGRALRDAGFEADLLVCAAIDSYPVIPVYEDRQITKLGPQRER